MKTTLDEMRTLIAVVDAGALSRAADHLGLTVSAVSRTLGRLEHKLNTTLLRRTTRRLELTEEGTIFLDRAKEIVACVEGAEEDLSIRRERPAGRLRVDAATPFMLHGVVPLISGYRERYPEVTLELTSNEGLIDLLEQRTDVAIRIGRIQRCMHGLSAAAVCACWQRLPILNSTVGRAAPVTSLSMSCWASHSRRHSMNGRYPHRTTCRCVSPPPLQPPAVKPCASWHLRAQESSVWRTS